MNSKHKTSDPCHANFAIIEFEAAVAAGFVTVSGSHQRYEAAICCSDMIADSGVESGRSALMRLSMALRQVTSGAVQAIGQSAQPITQSA